MKSDDVRLSYVIVTCNRRDSLLKTVEQVERHTPLPRGQWDLWVVDNGSTDGTAEALADLAQPVNIIRRPRNEGVAARNHALERAGGQYVVLLDDDSYPIGETIERSIRYLDQNRETAALTGRALLPDGRFEACALPGVLLSCAVCLRRSALAEVGGFRSEFFRKAGEYDLSFRLWGAGYRVERNEELLYRHDKSVAGRDAAFAHRMDVRNNLIVARRFLPQPLQREYTDDWAMRYSAIARHAGCGGAARRGRCEAHLYAWRDRFRASDTLHSAAVEAIFQIDHQAACIDQWARDEGVDRVIIADFGKNLYATWRGCREAGLAPLAIADENPAFDGLSYRGIPIEPDGRALRRDPDGVVISTINPAQLDDRLNRLRAQYAGPILTLWQPGRPSATVVEPGAFTNSAPASPAVHAVSRL